MVFVPPENLDPAIPRRDIKPQSIPDFPADIKSVEGVPKVLAVEEWFDPVSFIAQKDKWSLEEFTCMLITKLPPSFTTVIITTPDDDANTPTKLKKLILDLVCEDYDRSTAFRMLSDITQGPNERVFAYFLRFENLRFLAGLGDDIVSLDMAKRGLHKKILRSLIGRRETIKNLTDLALAAHAIQQDNEAIDYKPQTVTFVD